MSVMKFRNIPVKTEEGRFDSQGEFRRWRELQLLERGGAIEDLKRQVKLPIKVNGRHIAFYVADFVYKDGKRKVVEDYKSPATAKLPDFRLKWKLMQALYADHEFRISQRRTA